ncbi:hypothetical protein [Streptomyces violaceus]|uniref:Uncharacterized protein n=1 Tax=Streptomyces violaceus TaxID=1936 RepID=A0ABY9UNA9_STRVL|nr:hypothetical protein [Streptomyces janthinus]WND24083.1 hypothetical protein RI060_42960 [Streptomyces janthinus]
MNRIAQTTTNNTSPRPGQTPAGVYTTAVQAGHEAHCPPCRERAAASDAALAANGASMARRNHRDIRLVHTTGVTV